MITVVDYGMGNLGSVLNMLKYLGCYKALITSDIKKIERAEKLILPGVGSFKKAMANLEQQNFLPILNKKVIKEKVPTMGICLGMQLLFEKSKEGNDLPDRCNRRGDHCDSHPSRESSAAVRKLVPGFWRRTSRFHSVCSRAFGVAAKLVVRSLTRNCRHHFSV